MDKINVGITGMIGFVGLVAPHITRMLIGADNRFLVPASGLFGAAHLSVLTPAAMGGTSESPW